MSSLIIAGDTSGQITIAAPAVAGSNTLTLPVITDTITTLNSTQTLANKTLTAPVLSGTATGTYTLGGTPSLAATALTGTIAAARLPVGSVIQVVYIASPGLVTITSSAASVMSGSITPSSSSNKILIFAQTTVHRDGGGNVGFHWTAHIYKTNISTTLTAMSDAVLYQSYGDGAREHIGASYLDSPSTTSAVTYGIRAERASGTSGATFNFGSAASIVLMEIVA